MTADGDRRSPVELRDDVILLRPITIADADTYFERQDEAMALAFEWNGPATIDHVRDAISRWVESWSSGGPERNFAIVDQATGEMVGDCEVEVRGDGYLNVMYAVFAPWRKRGVATRAVALLAQYVNDVVPGRPLLFRIHPNNEGSLRVAKAAGTHRSGTELSPNGRQLELWTTDNERLLDF